MDIVEVMIIAAMFLVAIYETYEIFILRNRVNRLENENRELSKRLEDLRTFTEELSKSIGKEISIQISETNNDSTREISDNSLKRKLLELKIVSMYREGRSVSEIAKATGYSRVSIYRILKKYRES